MAASSPSEPTAEELVARARQGDADALSELLAIHGPQIERQLTIDRRWRAALEPADVMQVTYLEAFLQIGHFRQEQAASFGGWLRRIAENNLRDAIRGLERQKQPQPSRRVQLVPASSDSFVGLYDTLAATTTTPSRIAVRQDIQKLLQAAIARLPADYAATVRQYDLEGRHVSEVAAALGRSAGAVHMLRARAHERLGELLGTASAWFDSSA